MITATLLFLFKVVLVMLGFAGILLMASIIIPALLEGIVAILSLPIVVVLSVSDLVWDNRKNWLTWLWVALFIAAFTGSCFVVQYLDALDAERLQKTKVIK